MNSFSASFLFCVLLVCSVWASDVVDLTPDNYDDFMDGSKPAFVEFYAPWCGHCKRLAPEYELVGTAYKNKAVLIARVDCDAHGEICQNFEVTGYPTLKWFPSLEEVIPYGSGRTAEEIVNFVNTQTGLKARLPGKAPSIVKELTEDNFDQFVTNSNANVLVKFFAPWCGHCKSLEPIYESLANVYNNEEVVIARVDCDANSAVCQRFGVTGYPTLKWFAADGDRTSPDAFNDERTIDALVSFVNENAGTKRTTKGTLDETAGLLSQYHSLISELSAGSNDVISKAKEITDEVGTKMAKVYQRAFEKASEDAEYVNNEIARLNRMIASGSLTSAKIDEFTQRVNILNQFKNE